MIRIKEQQPPDNEPFWAVVDGKIMMLCREYIPDLGGYAYTRVYDLPYFDGKKWVADAYYDDNYDPTHWSPLPDMLNFSQKDKKP